MKTGELNQTLNRKIGTKSQLTKSEILNPTLQKPFSKVCAESEIKLGYSSAEENTTTRIFTNRSGEL